MKDTQKTPQLSVSLSATKWGRGLERGGAQGSGKRLFSQRIANLPSHPIRPCPSDGFTLTEMMVTMAIFGMVIACILSLHIFGLKLNRMVDVKLQATEDSRRALGRLVTDIHSAGIVKVGSGDASTFTEAAFNTAQRGNAIQIYPVKTNTAQFVRYYLDKGDNQLMRLDSASPSPTFVSGWVTNSVIFTSEDFSGNVLSNNLNNRVIGIDLEFYKLDNPSIQFGHGSYYDFYRLQTRVTRRALE